MTPDHLARDILTDAGDIAYHLPRWLKHMASQTPDGRPTQTGNPGVTGGDISDPTLTATIARTDGPGINDLIDATRPADRVDVILHNLALCRNLLREAREETINYPRTNTQITRHERCNGGQGQDGALEWGDPTCDEMADGRPSYNGLGIACYHRRRRWRKANGLDT